MPGGSVNNFHGANVNATSALKIKNVIWLAITGRRERACAAAWSMVKAIGRVGYRHSITQCFYCHTTALSLVGTMAKYIVLFRHTSTNLTAQFVHCQR
jgi:hypothetical protein